NQICFNVPDNIIKFNKKYSFIINNPIINKYSKNKKPIFAILHEIKHAIDWKYNKKRAYKEINETNYLLYKMNGDYAISTPFEKRANNFAKKEIRKWRK
ncbi:unnamed protein product, partial [marine sediment metagenome]